MKKLYQPCQVCGCFPRMAVQTPDNVIYCDVDCALLDGWQESQCEEVEQWPARSICTSDLERS